MPEMSGDAEWRERWKGMASHWLQWLLECRFNEERNVNTTPTLVYLYLSKYDVNTGMKLTHLSRERHTADTVSEEAVKTENSQCLRGPWVPHANVRLQHRHRRYSITEYNSKRHRRTQPQ